MAVLYIPLSIRSLIAPALLLGESGKSEPDLRLNQGLRVSASGELVVLLPAEKLGNPMAVIKGHDHNKYKEDYYYDRRSKSAK